MGCVDMKVPSSTKGDFEPCPIFRVFAAALQVGDEIDALVAEIGHQLRKENGCFSIEGSPEWDVKEDGTDWSYRAATIHFGLSIRRVGGRGRRKRDRYLTLRFDLFREASQPASSWPHAQKALLVVAFEPYAGRASRWGHSHLAVSAIGRPHDAAVITECECLSGGRLLEWSESRQSSRWSERSWFFAVPLSSLKSPDDVSRNVVKPVAALLGDKKPEQALSGTDAVTWIM